MKHNEQTGQLTADGRRALHLEGDVLGSGNVVSVGVTLHRERRRVFKEADRAAVRCRHLVRMESGVGVEGVGRAVKVRNELESVGTEAIVRVEVRRAALNGIVAGVCRARSDSGTNQRQGEQRPAHSAQALRSSRART